MFQPKRQSCKSRLDYQQANPGMHSCTSQSCLPWGLSESTRWQSEGKAKHSNMDRNRSQAHLWTNIEYQNLENYKKTFFCLFCLWDSPDYYICIYDWPGWHPIPQSSLLTYSSTPLFPTCLLLISEISVYAYSFPHSKSNGFCPEEHLSHWSNVFQRNKILSNLFQSQRALELGHLNALTLKYLYIFIYRHRLDAFYKDGSPIVYVIETPLDILLVCFHPWMVNWWSLIHRPVPL